MNNWMFIILGLFLVIVGCVNISGNISTIHSYQRRNRMFRLMGGGPGQER